VQLRIVTMSNFQLNKKQSRVILTVTFGNILEWFEIYSYAYLAPVFAKLFFNFESSLFNLFSAFLVFGSGFLARPFGAILFGRFGDLIGRKKAYVWSITIMTIPTFLMGCLPTYSKVGILAPLLLWLLRLIQSIPAAGEVPGTICFLYENSNPENTKFITSWTGVGNQIGAILGVIETFLMDQFMSKAFLATWGWRISFWIGGLIGLFGIYLRRKLYETPSFIKLKEHHKLDKETILQVINNYKKKIGIGIAYGAINASTFYLIATYIPTYFDKMFGLNIYKNAVISLSILFLTTVLLPVFGIIGEKYNNKHIFIFSTIMIVSLLYPFYIFVNNHNSLGIIITGVLYIIPITFISALLPYLLATLFPTSVRFTGVGLAFNLTDGIIGGFTPAIALFLLQFTKQQGAFCWFILACSLVSLFSYFTIKRRL
jgi:MFS transporter, MHS family, proline/betaine transporter